ncbi:MAG: hydrogenase formation protein HypD, partial [Bacteroidales bacterium]
MNQKEIYRDASYGKQLVSAIRKITTRPWKIMDTCGGQTHAIARYRIEEMLPPEISLIHGPGCPVCVTPADTIDTAIELAL